MVPQKQNYGFKKESGLLDKAALGLLKMVKRFLFIRTLKDPINTKMAIKFLDKIITNFENELAGKIY